MNLASLYEETGMAGEEEKTSASQSIQNNLVYSRSGRALASLSALEMALGLELDEAALAELQTPPCSPPGSPLPDNEQGSELSTDNNSPRHRRRKSSMSSKGTPKGSPKHKRRESGNNGHRRRGSSMRDNKIGPDSSPQHSPSHNVQNTDATT